MILLTGHKGFVGTTLMKALKRKNYKVIGLEKGRDFAQWTQHLFALADKHVFKAILHCGAISDNQYKNLDIFDWNTHSTRVLAAVCRRQKSHLIYMSSQTARAPKTLYGQSKKLAEHAIESIPGLDCCILQPFNIYGDSEGRKPPHCRSLVYRLASHELKVLWDTERDYVHVDDVVAAIQQALLYRSAGTFHVGTGVVMPSVRLTDAVKYDGYVCEDRPPSIEYRTCAEKARFLPGWQPKRRVIEEIAVLAQQLHEQGRIHLTHGKSARAGGVSLQR